MRRKKVHSAWLAGVAGALFPLLLMAAWTALSVMWRPPMSRVTAFLDPHSVHRGLHASTIVFDATVGALIGLVASLVIAWLTSGERWLACVVFLSAFAVACMVPTVLHEGWVRMPKVLGEPLIFGFVAAVVAGFWFAPRIAAWRTKRPGSAG